MTTTPSTITTITNPVLTGMYPDPTWMWDADNNRIAMVNSSFELVPGLPIHVSDDLGRWTHLADAIDEAMARRLLIPFVEDSGGVYAPTLRKVGGKYVIVCTIARIDADAARRGGVSDDELEAAARAEGNFAITAERLEGPWSGP
ncbi:MAG TPA: family 43 glycosylhydrolase, partial [Bifidobacterium pullorum]|nr:family 43 glycosylhydrolase [Bifidobacterium pullorum]